MGDMRDVKSAFLIGERLRKRRMTQIPTDEVDVLLQGQVDPESCPLLRHFQRKSVKLDSLRRCIVR